MAKGIYDLGNNRGYIYVTRADSANIVYSIRNTPEGSFQAKSIADSSRSVGQNLIAVGSIKIDTVTGTGTISAINIDSINQIAVDIDYTGATSVGSVASLIVSRINAHFPSGNNYTARLDSENATAYIYAPVSAGSTVNELAISVTNTGNVTYTLTDIDGGADADLTYDEQTGFRFFLDADYGTGTCSGDGVATARSIANALEITNYIVPRALNAVNPIVDVTITSGVITAQTRLSSITKYRVANEAAAATDSLTYISSDNFSEGDLLTLFNDDASSYFSIGVGEVGNMVTVNAIKVGDYTYRKDIFSSITFYFSNGVFYEVSRGETRDNKAFLSLTYGATTTWDVLAGANSKVTLTGNTTLAITEAVTGDYGVLIVTQDGTGNRVMTFPANSHFKGGLRLLSTGAGQVDIVYMVYDGTRYRFEISKDYSSL